MCPKCGGHDFTPLGEGKVTELYELVLARVERQLHVQEKVRCRCGETIITADVPPKVFDKTRFGPTFMAQAVVAKCADSIPLYRRVVHGYAGASVGLGLAIRAPHLDSNPLSRSAEGRDHGGRGRRAEVSAC